MNITQLYKIITADVKIKYFTDQDEYLKTYRSTEKMFDWVSPNWYKMNGKPLKPGYIIYYGEYIV